MANIARRHGVVMTEAGLAAAAGTTKDGTSAGQAALVFRRLGFPVVKRTITSGNLETLKPPAILWVDGDSHVVAFFGLTNGTASIVDSTSGLRLANRQRLAERWTGRALEIGAPKPE
jgi:ABC-type bacteriocin/lantibiotic exporter with double-glycine peptidase domain